MSRDFAAVNGLVRVSNLWRADYVAELLGIPVATLANWRAAGKSPPYLQVGRHVRYRASEVQGCDDVDIHRRTERLAPLPFPTARPFPHQTILVGHTCHQADPTSIALN